MEIEKEKESFVGKAIFGNPRWFINEQPDRLTLKVEFENERCSVNDCLFWIDEIPMTIEQLISFIGDTKTFRSIEIARWDGIKRKDNMSWLSTIIASIKRSLKIT